MSGSFFYGRQSDSAENVVILLILICVLALLKLPVSHKISFSTAYLHHNANVPPLLHGWCGRWQLVGLIGSLRSSFWLRGSGIKDRGHHHVLRAERRCNLVGPCPPGISFKADLPICSFALCLLPSQMISCFPLPALYLVQVPQTQREKSFQRFA